MEQNKTGRYFKYAIGEIILVVIGILIALQINNWNENRKLESSKQQLMLGLKNELLKNKNELEDYSLEMQKSNSKFNKVLLYSVGEYAIPNDSLKHYLTTMVYGRILSLLNPVQEEAISSGKFEMLSDSLKQSLSVLKDYTNSRNNVQERSTDIFNFHNNNEADKLLAKLYMLPVVPDEFLIHTLVPTHPDFLLSDTDLSILLKDSETYLTLNKIYLINATDEVWVKYGLLRLTNETIDLLDRELKND